MLWRAASLWVGALSASILAVWTRGVSSGCGGGAANTTSSGPDAQPADAPTEPQPDGAPLPDDALNDSFVPPLDDAALADSQGMPSGGDSSLPCRADSDCPQPAASYCVPCFEGGMDCARSQCINGVCVGVPGGRSCPGPITNPCAYKMCGNSCQQCSTSEGGCYPGVCNWFGACKAAIPICSIHASRGCAPSDALGVGDCNDFLGFGWDGTKCIAIVGCLCQGSDCGTLLSAQFDCYGVFLPCMQEGG
jgi:hypothetical protein